MLRLAIIILVIVVALLRGGSLRNFAAVQLRWLPLVIAGFALQLLIFTPFARSPLVAFATLPIYVLSLALLAIWVAANWRIPGMALIAIGLALNVIAITANGGHMPVSPESARYAGTIGNYTSAGALVANNSIATQDNVRFWLLTDIIAIPKQVPFASVISIGDVLLTIGVGSLCYRTIRRAPALDEPAPAPAAGSVESANEQGT
jgi:hypothetical protein